MKLKILILLSFALTLFTHSAEFTLAWTNSPTSGIGNYYLYATTNTLTSANRTNALVKLNTGLSNIVHITNISPAIWQFAASAVKDNVESDLSNVLIVDVPKPPTNMRIIAVQFSGTLSNFYDVGYFRLELK